MERERTKMEDVPRLSGRGVARLLGRVVLASRSPRRTWLLGLAGIEHETMLPGFEDGVLVPGRVPGVAVPAAWAYLKAWAVGEQLRKMGVGSKLVIGADTACEMGGALIGTPTSAAEAEEMIRAFMDREHGVLTGVALVRVGGGGRMDWERELFVDRARVWMGRLSEAELKEYVASGAWQGKAGGYNLLDRLNAGWPLRYEGDATTIMGLPMKRLVGRLETLTAVDLARA